MSAIQTRRPPLPRYPASYAVLVNASEPQIYKLAKRHKRVLRNPLALEDVANKSRSVLRMIETAKSVRARRAAVMRFTLSLVRCREAARAP